MSALQHALDSYLDSGVISPTAAEELAQQLHASYQVRRGVQLLVRDGRVVFAAQGAQSDWSEKRLSTIPCATCGALPSSDFPNGRKADGRRRYDCGPHKPIWPDGTPR